VPVRVGVAKTGPSVLVLPDRHILVLALDHIAGRIVAVGSELSRVADGRRGALRPCLLHRFNRGCHREVLDVGVQLTEASLDFRAVDASATLEGDSVRGWEIVVGERAALNLARYRLVGAAEHFFAGPLVIEHDVPFVHLPTQRRVACLLNQGSRLSLPFSRLDFPAA